MCFHLLNVHARVSRAIPQPIGNIGRQRRQRDVSATAKVLFSAENFFQEVGGLGGGVAADFYFFLSEHVEDAVQRFVDDVLIEVELASDGAAAGGGLDDMVIFLDQADPLHGAMDDGGEGNGEFGGTG